MKITSKFAGLIKKNGYYHFEGSIITNENLEIDLDSLLVVSGGIVAGGRIVAKWGIEAGWEIIAGGEIVAGGGIKAGGGIIAALSIKCKREIIVGLFVFAGTCTWRETTPEENIIECAYIAPKKVKSGVVRLLAK